MNVQIDPGLFIGDTAAAKDHQFLADADITAVINLTRDKLPQLEDVTTFEYIIPSTEFMDVEFPRVQAKIDSIIKIVYELRTNGRNVLIACQTGKCESALVAAYYLIAVCGRGYEQVIDSVEFAYFTPTDRAVDRADNLRADPDSAMIMTAEQLAIVAARTQRRNKRCLTMASHKKLLRIRGGTRK